MDDWTIGTIQDRPTTDSSAAKLSLLPCPPPPPGKQNKALVSWLRRWFVRWVGESATDVLSLLSSFVVVRCRRCCRLRRRRCCDTALPMELWLSLLLMLLTCSVPLAVALFERRRRCFAADCEPRSGCIQSSDNNRSKWIVLLQVSIRAALAWRLVLLAGITFAGNFLTRQNCVKGWTTVHGKSQNTTTQQHIFDCFTLLCYSIWVST